MPSSSNGCCGFVALFLSRSSWLRTCSSITSAVSLSSSCFLRLAAEASTAMRAQIIAEWKAKGIWFWLIAAKRLSWLTSEPMKRPAFWER